MFCNIDRFNQLESLGTRFRAEQLCNNSMSISLTILCIGISGLQLLRGLTTGQICANTAPDTIRHLERRQKPVKPILKSS